MRPFKLLVLNYGRYLYGSFFYDRIHILSNTN